MKYDMKDVGNWSKCGPRPSHSYRALTHLWKMITLTQIVKSTFIVSQRLYLPRSKFTSLSIWRKCEMSSRITLIMIYNFKVVFV